MNWKTEAMEKLKKYDAMRKSVENIPEELRRLELAATGIRSAGAEEAPVRGGNRWDDTLLSIMTQKQELQWALEQAQLWVRTTNRALGTLSTEEKLILHRLYMYPEKGSLARLCSDLGMEQSSVYRKRDRALHKFTLAFYGTADS